MLQEAIKLMPTLTAHRRYLHEHAELGFDLPKTRAYVMAELERMGYAPTPLEGGIVALAGGMRPGKTFLLRADMDALPILEESDLPYRCKAGTMHACGHDFHTAMLLGAAELLKRHEGEIEGQVKLMFQPAEETVSGAKRMVDAGVLEDPAVDAAFMIHVAPALPVPAGLTLFSGKDCHYAACAWFEIQISGKGGHGAMPDLCVDPLNIAAHIHLALQEIIAREFGARTPIVITVGEMHGGSVSNVIPDTAYLRGTIRTMDDEVMEYAKERVECIARGTAQTFRGRADVAFSMDCPAVAVDETLDAQLCAYTAETIGEPMVVGHEKLRALQTGSNLTTGMGSEDFSFISKRVKSACAAIAAGHPDKGCRYPVHHPKALFDEDALPYGAAVYAACAMKWLKGQGE